MEIEDVVEEEVTEDGESEVDVVVEEDVLYRLEDKHYYVMARSAGIVYNILGSDNYDY